jgi:hypothetical protein
MSGFQLQRSRIADICIGVAHLDVPDFLPPGGAAEPLEATRTTPVLEQSRP